MRYLCLTILFVVMVFPVYAEQYVVVNPDGSIHTVEHKPDEVLKPGQERFAIDDSERPSEDVNNYTFDKINRQFVRKQQSEIDAYIDDLIATEEAERLIKEYSDSLAAKEAKKMETNLDPKVIEKLTEKEKN